MADSQRSRKPRRSGPVPGTPAGGDRAPQSDRSLSRLPQRQAEKTEKGQRRPYPREEMLTWAQSRGQNEQCKANCVFGRGCIRWQSWAPDALPKLVPRYELLNVEYSGPKNTTSRLCSHIREPTNPSSPKSTSGAFQELCPGSTLPEASSWVPDQS